MVSHRVGGPTSTAAQISGSEVITWIAVGCCSTVIGSILSAIVGHVVNQPGIGLVVFFGVVIGVGVAANRRGWRQLALFVAGIALTYGFLAVAFLPII
jgi:hypothetical protein